MCTFIATVGDDTDDSSALLLLFWVDGTSAVFEIIVLLSVLLTNSAMIESIVA